MIIVMSNAATEEQIESVIKRIEEKGLEANVSRGTERTVIGAIGDERSLDPELLDSANARTQTSPSHHIDVETSSTHNSSVRGMTMSSQTCSPGSRNTTPPPLLRRTTSIFPRAHASASRRSGVWREPSTSAVCRIRTSNTDRSGVNVRACCSDALQCSCCTTHCALRGLGKILLPHLGHTAH